MAFPGAVHLTPKEIADMRRLIAQGLLPPNAVEEHYENERKAVFGENYKTDRAGNPLESGKGSAAQPTSQSVEAYRRWAKSEPGYEAHLQKLERELATYVERQASARQGAAT